MASRDVVHMTCFPGHAHITDGKAAELGPGVREQRLVRREFVGFSQVDEGRDACLEKSSDFLLGLNPGRGHRDIPRPGNGLRSPNMCSDRDG